MSSSSSGTGFDDPNPASRRLLMSAGRLSFSGGIGERWGLKVTAPWGHLEVDDDLVRIWGSGPASGTKLALSKEEASGVRISTGVLCVRISLVKADGAELEPFFMRSARGPVREALQAHGWPVIEDRWKLGRLQPRSEPEGG